MCSRFFCVPDPKENPFDRLFVVEVIENGFCGREIHAADRGQFFDRRFLDALDRQKRIE